MSRLAKDFTRVLRDQIRVYGAWLPVTNTLKVGDYGIIDSGVFIPMGNIRDNFGIEFETKQGPPSQINFSSEGTRVIRLAGGAEVDSLPNVGSIDANLKLSFSRERSFFLKSELSSEEMDNIHGVALQLARHPSWERKFKVVSIAYTSHQGTMIATIEKDTEVTLSAKADVLKQLEGGKANGEIGFSANRQTGFNSIGLEGIIGMQLFRIRRKGNVDFLKELTESDIEVESDFGEELPSDFE